MTAATWTTGILLALVPSEAAKAESAQPLAIAAGATAVAGVGIGFAAAARTMWEYRCIVDRPDEDTSDGGGSPFDFECWGATGVLFSVPIAALSVSTVVLSAVSGDRYGVADRLSGRRLDRETALAYTLGGIGAVERYLPTIDPDTGMILDPRISFQSEATFECAQVASALDGQVRPCPELTED